jgi:Trk K+ transport system NAD-binding subunit
MSQAAPEVTEAARRRVLYYVTVSVAAIVAFALLYQYAMAAFEGIQVSFVKALEVVVQTFTTTGYGEDAGIWDSPQMLVLMIVMQITGVVLIFLTLPLFLVPLVEAALRTDPPTESDLVDHVIICSFTDRGRALVNELRSMDVPHVIVESDYETATRLHEDGYTVVYGNPENEETLLDAGAARARALVADDDDETNASIVLSAKEVAPDLHVVTLVSDVAIAEYHRYAGADRVVSPRRLLGASLANKATTTVSSELGDTIDIGEDFEIAELLVHRGSDLAGRTVADSDISERTGVNIIGAWFDGEFVSPPAPQDVIDEHTILVVAGHDDQLERLKELTLSETRRFRRGTVAIVGYGEVGSTANEEIAAADLPVVVVDEKEKPGVDVVGDITERQTLEEANIQKARSVILALDDDTTAIFATLVIKQTSPNVEIIARANRTESVRKLYRAGAEYVLSLSTVSGRMLASNVLDEEVISPQTQVEVIRTRAPKLVGTSLGEADVRARTNCTIIAVERDGELITDVGPGFVVHEEDDLVVAGTDDDIYRFNELLA